MNAYILGSALIQGEAKLIDLRTHQTAVSQSTAMNAKATIALV